MRWCFKWIASFEQIIHHSWNYLDIWIKFGIFCQCQTGKCWHFLPNLVVPNVICHLTSAKIIHVLPVLHPMVTKFKWAVIFPSLHRVLYCFWGVIDANEYCGTCSGSEEGLGATNNLVMRPCIHGAHKTSTKANVTDRHLSTFCTTLL